MAHHSFSLSRLLYLFLLSVFCLHYLSSCLFCPFFVVFSQICWNGLPNRKFDTPPFIHPSMRAHTTHSQLFFQDISMQCSIKLTCLDSEWARLDRWALSNTLQQIANWPTFLPASHRGLKIWMGGLGEIREGKVQNQFWNWTFCTLFLAWNPAVWQQNRRSVHLCPARQLHPMSVSSVLCYA